MSPTDAQLAERARFLLQSAYQILDDAWNTCDHSIELDSMLNPIAEAMSATRRARDLLQQQHPPAATVNR